MEKEKALLPEAAEGATMDCPPEDQDMLDEDSDDGKELTEKSESSVGFDFN